MKQVRMRSIAPASLAVIAVLSFGTAVRGEMPGFDDYAVAVATSMPPADIASVALDLPPHAYDELRDRLSGGINYAGTAVLALWGCGSGCVSGGVYDAQTGNWFEFPFAIHRTPGSEDSLFAYRPDSRLLTATGQCNEDDFGQYYFQWNGQELVALDGPDGIC